MRMPVALALFLLVTACNLRGTDSRIDLGFNPGVVNIPTKAPQSGPPGFQALAGNGRVELRWSAYNDSQAGQILRYQVLRSSTSGTGYVSVGDATSALGLSDSMVTNGNTYYYIVRAINQVGAGPDSAEAVAVPDVVGITAGSPTPSSVSTGPVTFAIGYSGASSITLSASDITLVKTSTANCQVAVSGAGLMLRTVTLSSCTGNGTIALHVAAGTARNALNEVASALGPSALVTINTSGPALAIGTPASGVYISNATKNAFAVSGSCGANGRAVTLSLSDGVTTVAPATQPTCNTAATPNWSASFDAHTFADSSTNIIALIANHSDSIGNVAVTATRYFNKKVTSPTLAISAPTSSNYVNAGNQSSFTVSGSCSENGQTVTVAVTDGSTTLSPATQPICDTSATPQFSGTLNLSTLAQTSLTVSASLNDVAGNSASASAVTLPKDSTAPVVSITAPASGSTVLSSGLSAVTIAGSCSENGVAIALSATDQTHTVSATPTCNTAATPRYSATLDFSNFDEGSVSLSSSQTDVAGNVGTSSARSVTKDISAPTAASSLGWSQTSPSSSNTVTASWTQSTSTDLNGQTVQYYTGSACNTASGSAVVAASSAQTQSFTGNSGTYTYKVSSLDAAGNSTVSACSGAMVLREASVAQSTLAVASASIKKGQTSTITLTVKDGAAVQNTVGGLTVSFAASTGSGVATGTIGATTDNNDGTYSATFTATNKGTATTITASIGASAVTQTKTIAVTNTAPVIVPAATSFVFPLSGSNTSPPIVQGTATSIATTSDVDSDTVTLTCTYKTLGLSASDPNYAATGTNCSILPTVKTTNGTVVTSTLGTLTNSMSWAPTSTQRGTYEFTFDASDGSNAATQTVVDVTVREPFTTTNLLSSVDGLFATTAGSLANSTPAGPNATSSTATDWLNLISSGSTGTLHTAATPWVGAGTSTSPYAISLNGTSDYIDAGAELSGATKAALSGWVKLSAPTAAGRVIAGNGGGTGNGLVLRQSSTPTGRAEFVVGQKYYSYRDLVLSMAPVSYWRFNDVTSALTELSAYSATGTYVGTAGVHYTQGVASPVTSDATSKGTTFDGSNGYASATTLGKFGSKLGSGFSFSGWVKSSATVILAPIGTLNTGSTTAAAVFLNLPPGSGAPYNKGSIRIFLRDDSNRQLDAGVSSDTGITDGNWHYLVVTGAPATNTAKIYLDGNSLSVTYTSQTTPSAFSDFAFPMFIGAANSRGTPLNYFNGSMSESSVFNYALTSQQAADLYHTAVFDSLRVTYPGNAILADKPVGYWRLGEKSGARAADLSGNGNDGTYGGAVKLAQTGALANDSATSAAFDGSSSYLSVPTHANQNFGAQMTAMAWVKGSPQDDKAIIGKYLSASNSRAWQIVAPPSGWGYGTNKVAVSISPDGASGSMKHYVSSVNVMDGNWHHVAFTFYAGSLKIYIDGANDSTVAKYSDNTANVVYNSNAALVIGGRDAGSGTVSNFFSGNIQEAAIFDRALSPTELSQMFSSSAWWYCQSQTQLGSSNWNFLQGVWDGTKNALYVNGQKECEVTPGTPASSYTGSAQIIAGSDTSQTSSSFWQGTLSQLSFFGSSDGTAVASSTTAKLDFDAIANRYRATPQKNIVTSGLVLNLDAANSMQGVAFQSGGTCLTTETSWFDLSSFGLNGTLFNFGSGTNCTATSGWTGAGNVASPYALTFDGTNDYAQIPNASAIKASLPISFDGWVKLGGANTFRNLISTDQFDASKYCGADLQITNANLLTIQYGDCSGTGPTSRRSKLGTTTLSTGTWYHVAGTISGSTSMTLFINGVDDGGSYTGSGGSIGYSTVPGSVGAASVSANIFSGSMAVLRGYSTALTAQQIKQNCLAQEHRFTSTPQSICGAP